MATSNATTAREVAIHWRGHSEGQDLLHLLGLSRKYPIKMVKDGEMEEPLAVRHLYLCASCGGFERKGGISFRR